VNKSSSSSLRICISCLKISAQSLSLSVLVSNTSEALSQDDQGTPFDYELWTGGSETNLLQIARQMDRSRFSNCVVTMTDIPQLDRAVMEPRLEEAGLPFYSLSMQPGIPSPRAFARLLRILREYTRTFFKPGFIMLTFSVC
jgi:hypothetical protein